MGGKNTTTARAGSRKGGKKLKVLFTSYECAPFFKRGGLGDVALGLPKALSDLGHQPRVIIPLYPDINRRKWKIKLWRKNIPVRFGKKKEKVNIYRTNLPLNRGIALFISHPKFNTKNVFDKKSFERYVFYSKCVLDFIRHEGWKPDVLHANDWHTGAQIIYLNKLKKEDPWYEGIGMLYTIHNLAYQGWGKPNYEKWGLEPSDFQNKKQINLMSEGILGTDIINTVSGTYAKEILTKAYGNGLENFLKKRKKDLYGIVNGVDEEYFNPETDKELPRRYSVKNFNKKYDNKKALQKKLKLPVADVPLISMISRLAHQKGFNLVMDIMPGLLKNNDFQLVVMGTGDKKIMDALHALEKEYPKKVRALTFFGSPALAKFIYAGSDMFLMPSRFEPCGLGQLISMRYGTVPVVRKTGGLKDTVQNVSGSSNVKGTGFQFEKFNAREFKTALVRALKLYDKKAAWKKVAKNGMRVDSTWKNAAKKYINLYKKII